jgi:hypothetical protein
MFVFRRAVGGVGLYFCVALFILGSSASTIFAQCGGDRWNVKAGIDADAALVNTNAVVGTTVQQMTSLTKPAVLPDNNRIQPTETTTWRLSANLVKYVRSYDSDYHLVLRDDAGRTMIAEIPDPNCVNQSSPFKAAIAHARSQFDAAFTATTVFQTTNVPVVITGVGFFDYNEGQEGLAPNAIELHPILDIVFGPSFLLTTSPSVLTIPQGSTASSGVTVSLANGFNSSIDLAAGGLPSDVNVNFDPQTLPAPGQGTTTVSFAIGANTPTGTYSVSITGSGGGQSRSTSLTVNVISATGGSQQILANAGFENGSSNPAPWASTAGVIDNSGVQPARSGSWKAWLNGFGATHTDWLGQTTNIPLDSSAVALSFWLHIETAESTRTKVNDTLKIQVRNASGAVLATLANFSNLNSAAGYRQVTYDLTSYKGQSVQIYLVGIENGSGKTSFVVDDFSLVITRANQSPDLAISANSSTISVQQGANATIGVNTSVSGGFSSTVSLSASGLPTGASAAFLPSSFAAPGSGQSTLTISAASSAAAGTYPITITASGGGISRNTQVTLTVSSVQTGGVTRQLLGNNGFENGSASPSPWSVSSGVIDNNTAYQAPRSGSWKAWMNGYGSVHTDSLYQTATISSTATSAVLTIWRHIDTEEKTTSAAYDTLKIQIRNSSGVVISTLATLSNLNAASGYVQSTFDLLQFKGQTIQIYFVGIEDSSLKTSFVLDDLTLNVTTPQ